ncbi:hypothetical protein DL98DRAFT_602872 [Cadophora sp. DSE1049]|nr:hypothetical protein DL98DRAFT_602872 [Cadophora sp. DSE1049]
MPPDIYNQYFLSGLWQFRLFDNHENRTLVVKAIRENRMDWNQVWHHLVGEYSVRKFTTQTDRLPAIAGLADRLQVLFKWTYVAGLWLENLPQDLLWQREVSKNRGYRDVVCAEYVAPSWSWASANFPVWYDHYELGTFGNVVIEILETNVVPTGSNSKRAKVKLLQARFVREPMDMDQEFLCRIYDTTEEGGEKDQQCIYWDRASEMEDESDVFIAVFMFRVHGQQNGAGLALRKMDDGRYRRVGLARDIGHPFLDGVDHSEIFII